MFKIPQGLMPLFKRITTLMSLKPLVLYGLTTPNGVPVAAFLEELKAVYPGIDYE